MASIDSSDRLIIHRAVHARAADRAWSPTDVVRFSFSRKHKFFSAGHVVKKNRWGDHIISQFIEEVDTPDISYGLPQAFLDKMLDVVSKRKPIGWPQLTKELESIDIVSEINGDPNSLPKLDHAIEMAARCELPVSLALGQFLADASNCNDGVSADQRKLIRYFLKYVPLQIGHWGSYKRIYKLLEEINEAPDLLGLAISRVEGNTRQPIKSSPPLENLDFTWPLFQDDIQHGENLRYVEKRVGGERTRAYLGRRARRTVRALSKASPDQYATCAYEILINSDALGSYPDVQYRRSLAQVIYGRCLYDDSHGRGALTLPSASHRYKKRWDPSPQIWNQNLDLVRDVWKNVKNISDIQIWAFKILKQQKVTLPDLTVGGLKLALCSPAAPVINAACAQVAGKPNLFFKLDPAAGTAFLTFCTEKHFAAVLNGLEVHQPSASALEAIKTYLNANGVLPILRGEKPPILSSRTIKLISFYFRRCLKSLSEIEALNLAIFIGETRGFKPADYWREALEQLPVKSLVELRMRLPNISRAAIRLIDEACRRSFAVDQDEGLAMALAHSPTKSLRDLAWAILGKDEISSEIILKIWESLVEFSGSQDGLSRLSESVNSPHRLQRLAETSSSSPILSKIATILADTEKASSKRALSALATRGTSEEVLGTLNNIATACESWDWEAERSLVSSLILQPPKTLSTMWHGLHESRFEKLAEKVTEISSVTKALYNVVAPEDIVSVVPKQASVLCKMMRSHPAKLVKSREISIAASTCPSPDVASAAIAILESRGKIAKIYVQLLESRLPASVNAAQRYLESIESQDALTKAIIATCDSGIRESRKKGINIIVNRRGEYDPFKVYTALSEHKSPDIAAVVASHLFHDGCIKASVVEGFDQRVLKTRRQGRKAKELVKKRWNKITNPEVTSIPNSLSSSADRVEALLALARGRVERDREWAIQELVRLSQSGVEIPNFSVSQTS